MSYTYYYPLVGIKPLYNICIEKILNDKLRTAGVPLEIYDDIRTK